MHTTRAAVLIVVLSFGGCTDDAGSSPPVDATSSDLEILEQGAADQHAAPLEGGAADVGPALDAAPPDQGGGCKPKLASCKAAAECCSNLCSNGHCVCMGLGMSCSSSVNCCQGGCVGGKCKVGGSCKPAGYACTYYTKSSCCSGSCDGDSCCGYLGDSCPLGHGCCYGSCINKKCSCSPGSVQCGKSCANLQTSKYNCGACGNTCLLAGFECQAGTCVCADPAATQCGTSCFNLKIDPQHCGSCTKVCGPDRLCSNGTCVCKPGLHDCGGACVSLASNSHCGACNKACTTMESCVTGTCSCKAPYVRCIATGPCIDLQTNSLHCGTCNKACVGKKTCQGGVCK